MPNNIFQAVKFWWQGDSSLWEIRRAKPNADDLSIMLDGTAVMTFDGDGTVEIPSLTLDGGAITASAASLNMTAIATSQLEYTIGAEAVDVINVSIEYQNADATAVSSPQMLVCYLADTATGNVTGTAADTLAIGSSGLFISITTGKMFYLICDGTTGIADINITKTGAKTYYLRAFVPLTGVAWTSAAITFAA